VPVALRQRIGRRELVCSLGNCNAKTARLLADQLYGESEQLFEMARQNPMLSKDQLARLVQDFYNLMLERENVHRTKGIYLSEEQRGHRARGWREMSEEFRKALGANKLKGGDWTAMAAAKIQGLDWTTLGEDEKHQCLEAVHRAGIELANALAAKYDGDFNFEPKDKLLTRILDEEPAIVPHNPAPPKEEPATPAAPIFSKIYPDFIKSQVTRGDWRQQMASQADATYRLFTAICGDRPLPDYSRTDAMTFRKTTERMPYDYGKAAIYRDLSPTEIIMKYEALPPEKRSEPLTQKTIKRHFSALSKLWSEAVSGGDVAANIFTGFKFANVKRAADERDMWKANELSALFSSPIWTGCANERQRSTQGDQIIRDEKFWVPLITLFSGMRLEEICQLRTDDIGEEDGIDFFDLNDRPPRQLKNKNAVHRVPIHSELVRLGLLQYANSFGKHSYALFPQLKPGGADNKLGHAFSKWFTRYRQQINQNRKNLDFHSLRHTATTLMHQAGVNTMVIDHVTGHSTAGETARYTKGSALNQLAAAIESIRPPLDFRHLHGQRGQAG
jgi:integrase